MIIYRVNIKIKKVSEEKWFNWMKGSHIPDVLNTYYFNKCRLYKVVDPKISDDELSYVIDYETDSMEKYEKYLKNEAKRLQAEHTEKFRDQFTASRTILEVVETFQT